MFVTTRTAPRPGLLARLSANSLQLFCSAQATEKTSYENYDRVSSGYDDHRVAIGIPTLRNLLGDVAASQGKQVSELSILDAGCGTGNYLSAMCDIGVGRSTGVDFSEGMLTTCREKLAAQQNGDKVTLIQGSVLELSEIPGLAGHVFDVVMMNQMLHHLHPGPGRDAEGIEAQTLALAQACQLLKPGGGFFIQTSLPDQVLGGFWWTPVIPVAMDRLAARMPSEDLIQSTLEAHGVDDVERVVPELAGDDEAASSTLMAWPVYEMLNGPLDVVWRNGISSWSLATNEELQEGLELLRGERVLGNPDGGASFFEEREAQRAQIGQTSTFVGRKKLQ